MRIGLTWSLPLLVACQDAQLSAEDSLGDGGWSFSIEGEPCRRSDDCEDSLRCLAGICVRQCGQSEDCSDGYCNPVPGSAIGWCSYEIDAVPSKPSGTSENLRLDANYAPIEFDQGLNTTPSPPLDLGALPSEAGQPPARDMSPGLDLGLEDAAPLLSDAQPEAPCRYPEGAGVIQRVGEVMPRLSWPGAFKGDGSRLDFDLLDFHCGEEWSRYAIIAFIIGAEWCGACAQYIRELAPQAAAIGAAGGLLIFVEVQTADERPASNEEAHWVVSSLAGDAPSLRVGDGETRPRSEILYNAPMVQAFPTAFVVRRSDMRIISNQEQNWGTLDYARIAQEEGGLASAIDPSPIGCEEEASEPNNSFAQAAPLQVGEYSGGICDAQPDFLRVNIQSNWSLDLLFSHAEGDLDICLMEENSLTPMVVNGQRLCSLSTDDNERLEWSGPSVVAVMGYEGARASYRIRLQ